MISGFLWFEPEFLAKCVGAEPDWEGELEAQPLPATGWSEQQSSCHLRLPSRRRLHNPYPDHKTAGCFLFVDTELKLNRKMCLALNWALQAGNRETLGYREEQPARS